MRQNQKFCTHCGAQLDAGSRFCTECGAEQCPTAEDVARSPSHDTLSTEAAAVEQTMSNPADTSAPADKDLAARKKKIMLGVVIGGFLFLALLLGYSEGGIATAKYVQVVQTGTMQRQPGIKIGKAFDNFFADGKWRSFVSTTKQRVVEFEGECTWFNQPGKCKIQFLFDGEKHFHLGAVSINGFEMSQQDALDILDKALTGK